MQWATQESETLSQHYDIIIATSMVDLVSLRGLVPALTNIPTLLYFHENQFAYPEGRQRDDNLEPKLVPIYAVLGADMIAFNTQFNRDTMLQGVMSLSKALPDPLPDDLFSRIEQAALLPVPLPEIDENQSHNTDPECLEVLWNHRWEYDKRPELLLAVVRLAQQKHYRYRFHVVGQQFRQQPEQFAEIETLLTAIADETGIERGAFGYLEDETEYRQLLNTADVVLSTALHDFQGLAIQEACLHGCWPIAPDALAYPEYLPAEALYAVQADNDSTAKRVLEKLQLQASKKQQGETRHAIDLSDFQEPKITARYGEVFNRLLESKAAS